MNLLRQNLCLQSFLHIQFQCFPHCQNHSALSARLLHASERPAYKSVPHPLGMLLVEYTQSTDLVLRPHHTNSHPDVKTSTVFVFNTSFRAHLSRMILYFCLVEYNAAVRFYQCCYTNSCTSIRNAATTRDKYLSNAQFDLLGRQRPISLLLSPEARL